MSDYKKVREGGGTADAGSMQLAFQQFMLKSKNNQQSHAQSSISSTISEQDRLKIEQQQQQQNEINKFQSDLKKGEKQYWSIFHRFCNLLRNQWIDIDDQALLVIESIAGIRQRLPIEMKLVQKYKDSMTQPTNIEWKNHAHNNQLTFSSSLLSQEDVERAFNHDLQQHEKMMEGLRSLFASLSEMHESMSRTLDELMKHHLNQDEQILSRQEFYKHYPALTMTSYNNATALVYLTTELFHMFSLELYRKQSLVQCLLDSADDRVLSHQVVRDDQWYNRGPKFVIQHCMKQWPRSCSQSCIDNSVYDLAMKKHDKTGNSN